MSKSKLLKCLVTVFMSISLISCSSDDLPNCTEHEVTDCNEVADKANLRIKNTSQYDYCNVLVILENQTVNYGNILSGNATCLVAFDLLYTYAYVQLFIDGNEFVIQPIDFVGEVPLPEGNYTYKINVPDSSGNMYSVELEFE